MPTTRPRLGLGERAARLVERGWCKGTAAVDSDGEAVRPNSRRAVRWCAFGAIAAHRGRWLEAIGWLRDHLEIDDLGDWNDRPRRTAKQVAALLRKLPVKEFP